MTDLFVPITMNPNIARSDLAWFRMLVHLNAGVAPGLIRDRLRAVYWAFEQEQIGTAVGIPKRTTDGILNQKIFLASASAGISDLQQGYGKPLLVLAVLVTLVLWIACANIANLMMAEASARLREMALRISIGAGRGRLMQLVLVESAMLALAASAIGAVVAWWSAPWVVSRIQPPDDPVRLSLSFDWRVLLFAVALSFVVMLLFGSAPALRASAVRPASALKGGEDPRFRGRLMRALVLGQAVFCFFVLFVAGLFVSTLERLSHQSTGFSPVGLVAIETAASRERPSADWEQAAQRLRALPGVESVALSDWPLMSENMAGGYISVNGGRPFSDPAFFLNISPAWIRTMQIPLLAGRDIRIGDANHNAAIVNDAFVDKFLKGDRAPGRQFSTMRGGQRLHFDIAGVVANARYADLRGPMPPVAYFPFESPARKSGAFLVRASGAHALALASILRRELARVAPELRITRLRTQDAINRLQTIRERLLAALALFFAVIALLLAAVGLYGVLDYFVLLRRREIGIHIALGADVGDVAWHVCAGIFLSVLAGAAAGLGLGMISVRYFQALLYEVRPAGVEALAIPSFLMAAVTLVASIPAVIRAVHVDPAKVLRAD